MSVPWTATGKESGEGVYHIRSGEGYRVAMAYSVDDTSRIVRAVNSHADLLEAAKLALYEAEGWVHDQLDGTSSLDDALARLDSVRAAIAAAEGDTT